MQGGSHIDDRGRIAFVNNFDFEGVRQFYTIHHHDTSIVRAWQGHIQEAKYYYPVKGIWLIKWVKLDFTISESSWKTEYIVLKAEENRMLFLPPGYANGFKALEKDAIITGFTVPGKEEETILLWP